MDRWLQKLISTCRRQQSRYHRGSKAFTSTLVRRQSGLLSPRSHAGLGLQLTLPSNAQLECLQCCHEAQPCPLSMCCTISLVIFSQSVYFHVNYSFLHTNGASAKLVTHKTFCVYGSKFNDSTHDHDHCHYRDMILY